MNTKAKLVAIASSFAIAGSANAMVIADLHADFTGTDFSGAVVGTTTFTTNNWSFFHGFNGLTELTFQSGTLGTDAGTGFGDGTAGGGFGQTALVSAEGVFDGVSPNAGELTFHPSNVGGAAPLSDLHIRWTADQDYLNGITVAHNLRTPSNSIVGLAYGLNGANVTNITTNIGAAGSAATTDSSTFVPFGSISSGDVVDIIVFRNGNFNGDQTFGNFVVSAVAVPEPSSVALLGLGGFALILRRRR